MESVEYYNNLLHLPYLEIHEIAMLLKGYKEAKLVPIDPKLQAFTQRKQLFLNRDIIGLHNIVASTLKKD